MTIVEDRAVGRVLPPADAPMFCLTMSSRAALTAAVVAGSVTVLTFYVAVAIGSAEGRMPLNPMWLVVIGAAVATTLAVRNHRWLTARAAAGIVDEPVMVAPRTAAPVATPTPEPASPPAPGPAPAPAPAPMRPSATSVVPSRPVPAAGPLAPFAPAGPPFGTPAPFPPRPAAGSSPLPSFALPSLEATTDAPAPADETPTTSFAVVRAPEAAPDAAGTRAGDEVVAEARTDTADAGTATPDDAAGAIVGDRQVEGDAPDESDDGSDHGGDDAPAAAAPVRAPRVVGRPGDRKGAGKTDRKGAPSKAGAKSPDAKATPKKVAGRPR